jgi:hypothetical protein
MNLIMLYIELPQIKTLSPLILPSGIESFELVDVILCFGPQGGLVKVEGAQTIVAGKNWPRSLLFVLWLILHCRY